MYVLNNFIIEMHAQHILSVNFLRLFLFIPSYQVPLGANGCAYFPFEELCDKPLGAADYFGLFSESSLIDRILSCIYIYIYIYIYLYL